jgi:hypothetical protein
MEDDGDDDGDGDEDDDAHRRGVGGKKQVAPRKSGAARAAPYSPAPRLPTFPPPQSRHDKKEKVL